jgi:hypothetical protein
MLWHQVQELDKDICYVACSKRARGAGAGLGGHLRGEVGLRTNNISIASGNREMPLCTS